MIALPGLSDENGEHGDPMIHTTDPVSTIVTIPRVIAIDGPSAAGKGTLSRAIAKHYGWQFLDTGSLYRGLAFLVIKKEAEHGNPSDTLNRSFEQWKELTQELTLQWLSQPELRTNTVADKASIIAADHNVRLALLSYQRDFPHQGDSLQWTVMDGRDIGTTIFPDAPIKIFVTAHAEIRARRRWIELQSTGRTESYDAILEALVLRDKRDACRTESPTHPADDAVLLDTSTLSPQEALDQAIALIDQRLLSLQ